MYAVDYPGHGWSDIPQVDYTPEVFTRFVADFLERLEIENAVLAGVSIGASIGLLLAAAGNPRVRAVVAVNPYDYGKRGIERANGVARVLFTAAPIPVLGETAMRLRNPVIEGKVLEGGVAFPSALPESFLKEVFQVGERPGHYQAFLNLIRRMPLWRRAREAYGRIRVPVLLVYGDRDWSREAERQANLRDIPTARLVMVSDGGHFLPLIGRRRWSSRSAPSPGSSRPPCGAGSPLQGGTHDPVHRHPAAPRRAHGVRSGLHVRPLHPEPRLALRLGLGA